MLEAAHEQHHVARASPRGNVGPDAVGDLPRADGATLPVGVVGARGELDRDARELRRAVGIGTQGRGRERHEPRDDLSAADLLDE